MTILHIKRDFIPLCNAVKKIIKHCNNVIRMFNNYQPMYRFEFIQCLCLDISTVVEISNGPCIRVYFCKEISAGARI